MKFKINNETPASVLGYGIIPAHLRGTITESPNWRKAGPSNVGRKPTNAEYASQHGITKRQASKKRRGY